MTSRRRSRRKSITGNITDINKRLRFLETRPSPSSLSSKVVVTKNFALRSVETELIGDGSITTRTIGESQVTNFTLSSVSDPDGPAVDTENIATGAVENSQLDGGITDSKISGMSSSKLIGLVEDPQIAGLSTTKLIGTITNDQIADLAITQDKIVSLPTTKLTETIINNQLAGSITQDKIVSLDADQITGTVTNAQLADLSVSTAKFADLSVTTEKIQDLAITTNKYASRSIDNQRFALGAILEDLFINGAVTENKIRAGAVTRLKIPVGGIEDVKIAAVASTKISGAVSPTSVSGLTNVLNTASVSGTGISRSFSVNGNYRALSININTGTGSSELAVGNHTHNTIAAHGHSILFQSQFLTPNQAPHGHPGVPPVFSFGGSHAHSWPAPILSVFTGITPSTIRIKKDVSDYALNDPKNILNLKMKRYKYKNSKRGYHDTTNREWMYGYIAEDLQELGVEEVLSYDKDGLPDGIDYGAFSMLVLELAKVRQIEIDYLKEEIKRLKEMV
jgi:hypothetical protein